MTAISGGVSKITTSNLSFKVVISFLSLIEPKISDGFGGTGPEHSTDKFSVSVF